MLVGLLAVASVASSAQTKGSIEMSGGLYFNDIDVFSAGFDLGYSWRFGEHLMLSASGGVLYSMLFEAGDTYIDCGETLHYGGEDSMTKLVGNVGVTLTQPVVWKSGLYVRGTFQFDLLPFESIGLERTVYEPDGRYEDNPSKLVFTGFSPGVFGEVGVYHDFSEHRLFVGFGYGVYDLFHSYRHHSVDGIPMRSFAPQDDTYYRFTVRLIGL